MTVEVVRLDSLVFDVSLYPRRKISPQHVNELARVAAAGIALPPIIIDRATRRVVDGWHRCEVNRVRGLPDISAEVRDYADDKALFTEAMRLGSDNKLPLDSADKVHCAQIAERLGIDDATLAAALALSFSHLRSIKQRYATVGAATQAVEEARRVEPVEVPISELRHVEPPPPDPPSPTAPSAPLRVPLKASTRHLSGRTITLEQAHALESAPGQSYLLLVRQLIDGLTADLLPPADAHPTLWQELRRLHSLLGDALS